MGKNIKKNLEKIGVSIQKSKYGFVAAVSIQDLARFYGKIEKQLTWASKNYEIHLKKMQKILEGTNILQKKGKKVPAALMWDLGDTAFKLIDSFSEKGLDFVGFYSRLTEDLKISKTTLSKVLIFRRYLQDRSLIPKNLNWGRVKDNAKQCALELSQKKLHRS